MVSHVLMKRLKITANTAGLINFEVRRNIFPWPHTDGTGHVDISGGKEAAVNVDIESPFRFHKFISMMKSNVMKGLSLFEKRRHHIIKLFKFSLGESETGTGFASDLFVFLLCKGSFIKLFFQRAFGALRTAVADIGRFGKFRANIFFIRITRGKASAAGPTVSVMRGGTVLTNFMNGTLMKESQTAVVERTAVSTGFFETDMGLHFF